MKYNNTISGRLTDLIMEHTDTDWETAIYMAEEDIFFEDYDEEEFKEIMGDIPQTMGNILDYYEKNPDEVEAIVDGLKEDAELRSWNVNAWRNS